MSPKVFFYVQHLLGVGHLARASLVAKAFSDAGMGVLLVTGGMPLAGFPDSSLRSFALPSVSSAEGFSGLLDEQGRPVDAAFQMRRRDLLLGLFEQEKPEALLIEAYPFGRRQMRFELVPLVERARVAPWRPLIACSLRDILQERGSRDRTAGTVETLKRSFDLVLLHGDPDFVPLEATFPAAPEIGDLIRYTGIVTGPVPPLAGGSFDILVSAGGGAAGLRLMQAARAALDRMPRRDLSWCFMVGPNLPANAAACLSNLPPNAIAAPNRPDFRALLAKALLSVSQCGYNTAADVLQAGCRAVFVPFAAGGETEQTRRALALEARKIATVLAEDELSGSALAAAIESSLASRQIPAWKPKLDGAPRSAQLLLEAIKARSGGG